MAEWTAPHDEEVQKLFKAQGVRLLKRGPGLPLIGVEERGPAKVKHYRCLISEKGLARLEGYASHELLLD